MKTITRLLLLLVLLIFCLQNTSCRKKPEVGEDYLLTRGLGIYFRDSSTNQLLIGRTGEKFSADTIKAYRIRNGQKEIIGSAVPDSIGQYACGILYLSTMAFKNEDINYTVIDLPVYIYFNQFDTDTLLIKKPSFEDIAVFFNEKRVATIPALDQSLPYRITIKK